MTEEKFAWDIMDGEPGDWYAIFNDYYRKQAPIKRSIRGAYDNYRVGILGKEENSKSASPPQKTWYDNAKKYKWEERARAWDEFVYREKMKLELEDMQEMLKRQATIGREMQALARAKVSDEFKEIQKTGRPLFDIAEARLLYKEGIAIERQAKGLPDYLLAVANLSDEELLSRYDRLLADVTQTERIESSGSDNGGEGDFPTSIDKPQTPELPAEILE